ncbi:HesB/IscA family protein [Azohydromonas sediminis]|uniref:HesB/IscA family protein n=1 Tax=Azohydromonas sediminis TaxID=2259674 RepID=UPI000E65187D|nr:iron-sulfur cluster assembly accessory protein [Azohydromonas sediminis]
MLTVTDAALEQIRSAALQGRAVGMALRVAARRADDGSIEYGMGFDDTHDEDEALEFDGLTVVVAAASRPLLRGTTLDWVELEPGERRFIFIPPADEAPPARGCGSGGCSRCGG